MKYRVLILLLTLVILLLCSCNILQTNTHKHNFSNGYSFDETYHWIECKCEEIDGYAEHTWNNGVIKVHPTTESEGVRTYTCTVCRYKKDEPIAKLEENHQHSFEVTYNNEYTHVLECVCGEISESTEHVWDAGVMTTPATETDTGIMTFTCIECERKYTELIYGEKGLSFSQAVHHRITKKLSANPLTIEAEIYVDPSISGRAGAILGNYIGVREDMLLDILENGVPRFYYSDASDTAREIRFNSVDVRTGDWAHIALTFDFEEGVMLFYLDGRLAQMLPCEYDLADDITRYEFVLGGDNRSNNGNYFKGQIRSVAVYSDVRTEDEISESCHYGINIYADGILAAYVLNENSAEDDIVDFTGNGYDIPKEWLDSYETQLDYAYSFAVVGDTQWLSRYSPAKMEGLYDWIVENKDEKKISYVFGLGDITDAWNTADKENEWIRAHQYISKLDGVIPYSLVRGNHDESKYFSKYFANEIYMSQFDGFMVEGDIRNFYKIFTVGETDYLLLGLDYGASDEMLAWANNVVATHPNHKVIVTTHVYHGYDGGHLSLDNVLEKGNITPSTDVDTSVGEQSRDYNNGQMIWEKFVSRHPNILLVLSGHTPMEDVFVLESTGVHGNTVTQMLIDAQWMDPQKNGVGMVALLCFSEDGTQMAVEWISTDTGKYYKEMNQFQIDLTEPMNAPSHDFKTAYDEKSHHKICDCGCVVDVQAHIFDDGIINADGLMEYSCACGYKRITSTTEDPIAVELQALIEKYYNGGKYYKDTSNITTFYNGNKLWTTDDEVYENTDGYLTLDDIVMGKYGDLKLDLGWNCYNGVYYSANADVINGLRMFALSLKTGEASNITKVTIEEDGALLLIQLWEGSNVAVQTRVGDYAKLTLVNHSGETLGVEYAKSNAEGLCRFMAPTISGLVAEYEYLMLSIKHDELEKTVCYSELDVWDGTSVSDSLSGSGTKEDPYLIQSGADLAYIAKVVNEATAGTANFKGQYFKMTKSIDLNGNELKIGGYTAGTEFHGYFDGNHCAIKGIKASQSLFGMLKNGYIKNLSTYGSVTTTEKKGVAGLVSFMSGATVENIVNYVSVTGVQQVAGVVGWLENNTTTFANNCVNYGTIYATSYQIGGIAGFAKGSLTGCRNFGDVTSTGSGYVGGIGGAAKDAKGSRSDCVNYGNIKATSYVGGCFGQITATTTNCYSYGTATGTTTTCVGDVVGTGQNFLTYT